MRASITDTETVRSAVIRLLEEKSPVLVEVRFPHMGTSSDWFLCEDATEVDAVVARVEPGVEVHLSSVWDLRDATGGVVIRK